MMKKNKILIVIILAILTLSNVFSSLINTLVFGIGYSYTYETDDGKYKFSYVPSKGDNLETLLLRFKQIQKDLPEYDGTYLTRTFKQKPLQFWNWSSYMFSKKYSFPYKESSGESQYYKGLRKK